ncbi:MAG: hypothetical protein SGI90_09175 [Candidatus Eisenbacteria bacterium]|nr:hypothetical protein [Candidatus Eisenbacteria bacterium]
MRRSPWLARFAGIVLLLGFGFAGLEFLRGRRGPLPAPTEDSKVAGRNMLNRMLDMTGARWTTTDPVSFIVTPIRFGRPEPDLAIRLDPRSRILSVQPGPGAGEPIVFDPADGSLRPDGDATLRTLLPSIDFWAIAPGVFDDPNVILWRLPDAEGRARVAVRWPNEADWFILESAPGSDRLESLEFVDARFGVFLRWRGFYDGPLPGGAAPLPAAWRFRAASPVLDALLGRRELVALRFRHN